MKKILAFFTLFTSAATLICCALPALLVGLGFGAAVVGLISHFPQLVWLSEHKGWVFATAGCLLLFVGLYQWRSRFLACPVDPLKNNSCGQIRDFSLWLYGISIWIYFIGVLFAYGLAG